MNQAVLVIDVQRGPFAPEPRPFESELVLGRINAITTRARESGVPVVFVHHENAVDELEHGSANWQLEPSLVTAPSDVTLRKTTPDAFLRTDLSELLTKWNVTQLVICGYATEFCVDTTTRRAMALGYAVVLASDAHTTHGKAHATGAQIREHHNATLANIQSFGPRVITRPTSDIAFR